MRTGHTVVAALLVCLIVFTSGCSSIFPPATTPSDQPKVITPVPTSQPTAASRPAIPLPTVLSNQPSSSTSRVGGLTVVDAAARTRPAVVNITSQVVTYDMFLRPTPEEAGVGSGVIFDPKGFILTNNHVVEGAQSLKVTLPDGRTFEGTIVGADERTDLAVVKIEGDNLPTAELGDSDRLQIGEQVVAIGNALALPGGPTVTAGVVGAIGRHIRTETGNILYDLIQTDAAINPGNSGGPLINLAGQVVGINTAIAEAPGGGIGFAIAINGAKPIFADLMAYGRVRRPWLGVEFTSVTPSLAAAYNLPVNKGVIISGVVRGSPAAKAGLRVGDIIVGMDEEQIDDVVQLLKNIASRGLTSKVKLTIYRGQQRLTVDVTLEEMPQR